VSRVGRGCPRCARGRGRICRNRVRAGGAARRTGGCGHSGVSVKPGE
jgi:hypothetical protein